MSQDVNQSADNLTHLVAIVMGSKSDFEVMKESVGVLKAFEVPHEVRVISAHRTPDNALDFASGAEDQGFKLIIAAAGKVAHLASAKNAALLAVSILALSDTRLRSELKTYRQRMRAEVEAADAEIRTASFSQEC
jgi:phosphoribosylcarboxyaminoimidazole (NCAIR) mutase